VQIPVDTFWAVISASSLACLVTTIGIVIISRYEQWGTEHSAYFMRFAAGVLISVSFMHIIPKSFEMNDGAENLEDGQGVAFTMALPTAHPTGAGQTAEGSARATLRKLWREEGAHSHH
jgi:zinc transporter ZupT